MLESVRCSDKWATTTVPAVIAGIAPRLTVQLAASRQWTVDCVLCADRLLFIETHREKCLEAYLTPDKNNSNKRSRFNNARPKEM